MISLQFVLILVMIRSQYFLSILLYYHPCIYYITGVKEGDEIVSSSTTILLSLSSGDDKNIL